MAMATLKDIADLPKLEISPTQACSVIGGDPHYLYLQARDRPDTVPFSFRFSGRNLRINKASFLRYYGYEGDTA